MALPWFDQSPVEELPLYLVDSGPPSDWTVRRMVDGLAAVRQQMASQTYQPAAPARNTVDHSPSVSPVFARAVRLSRGRLAAGLKAWGSEGGGGSVSLRRRLQLGPPVGDPSVGWTMRGRVRRLTPWHWVPVVVELWPMHEQFTRMTMTPQAEVFASRRYFKLGNRALDRLGAALAELSTN